MPRNETQITEASAIGAFSKEGFEDQYFKGKEQAGGEGGKGEKRQGRADKEAGGYFLVRL